MNICYFDNGFTPRIIFKINFVIIGSENTFKNFGIDFDLPRKMLVKKYCPRSQID